MEISDVVSMTSGELVAFAVLALIVVIVAAVGRRGQPHEAAGKSGVEKRERPAARRSRS